MKNLAIHIGKSLLAQFLAVGFFALLFGIIVLRRTDVAASFEAYSSATGFAFCVFGGVGLPILLLSTLFHVRLFHENK